MQPRNLSTALELLQFLGGAMILVMIRSKKLLTPRPSPLIPAGTTCNVFYSLDLIVGNQDRVDMLISKFYFAEIFDLHNNKIWKWNQMQEL